MTEALNKKTWKLWEWHVVTKDKNSIKEDSFNMPYLNTEPNEDDIRSFIKNFRPKMHSILQSVSWKFVREYVD